MRTDRGDWLLDKLPKCWRCNSPTECDDRMLPREEKTYTLHILRCTNPDCRWTGHLRVERPGPWRLLQKSRDSWVVGIRCPECDTPVEFKRRRRRADCTGCGCKVDRDGKVGIRCEYCGKHHWTERSGEWCILFQTLKEKVDGGLSKALPGGSKEPPPWGDINAWTTIRDGIMNRDGHKCLDCGRREMEIHGDILEAHGYARDTAYCDIKDRAVLKKLSILPTIEVHHIIPKIAGGTDHPGNLVTLCRACHRARHDAIGDGYHPYIEVSMAIIRDEVVGEERAALLSGDHSILEEVAMKKELKELPKKERRLKEDIMSGVQRTLD